MAEPEEMIVIDRDVNGDDIPIDNLRQGGVRAHRSNSLRLPSVGTQVTNVNVPTLQSRLQKRNDPHQILDKSSNLAYHRAIALHLLAVKAEYFQTYLRRMVPVVQVVVTERVSQNITVTTNGEEHNNGTQLTT